MLIKKYLKIIVAIAITLFCFYWISESSNWTEVKKYLLSVNYWWFIPATITFIVQIIIRGIRWKYLLPEEDNSKLSLRSDSVMVGNFVNFILPLRVGEFVRPGFFAKNSNTKYSPALFSVIIERFFDLFTVLASFALLLLLADNLPEIVYSGAYIFTLIAFLGIVFLFLSAYFPSVVKNISFSLLKLTKLNRFQLLENLIMNFLNSVLFLRNSKKTFMIIFCSILIWIFTYLQYYLMLCIFDQEIFFWWGICLTVVVALSVAAPNAAPGFLGVYQGGCIIAFSIFGMSNDQAVAYSILTHAHQYIMIILYGIFLLYKYGLKFNEVISFGRK